MSLDARIRPSDVIEPRLYRAAFIPALLALIVVAFSLQNRPPVLPQDSAADVLFDEEVAAASAARIARKFSDRRPGSPGDIAAAEEVSSELATLGFDVTRDEFAVGEANLVNVVATRTGADRDQIVVMAPRDAREGPEATGSASDTATLIELGRALQGRAPTKTLVLVSVDGSSLGEAGVRRFIETAEDASQIEAVLTTSQLGAGPPSRPALIAWSEDYRRGNLALELTTRQALRTEFPDLSGPPGIVDQVARLALPIAPGAQGLLLGSGYDAVRVSGAGELAASAGSGAAPDPERLGQFGRSMLQAISALDAGELAPQLQRSYVTVGRKVLPGWAVGLLGMALILPALIASIDATARARRRGEPVGAWFAWLARCCTPFVAALVIALMLGLAGLALAPASGAPSPDAAALDAGAVVMILLLGAIVVGGWMLLEPLQILGRGLALDPGIPGAGVALSLAMSLTALVLWLLNPFAALFAVVPLHAWMLATLGDAPMRGRARVILFAVGLLPAAALGAYYLLTLGLDPATGGWYLVLLVTGGQVGLLTALVISIFLGLLVSTLTIVLAQIRAGGQTDPHPAIRGPGGFAGPGSLGTVQSGSDTPRRR